MEVRLVARLDDGLVYKESNQSVGTSTAAADSGQWTAASGQRPAANGQRAAVSGQVVGEGETSGEGADGADGAGSYI